MALLRLSLVTQGLLDLISIAITSSPEWPGATILLPSPDPPDRLAGDHTVGLYLYHAIEDPNRRNEPPPGGAGQPERNAPMPLLLYYLLTAHSDLTGGQGTLEEQFVMGLAMKALRDFPVLDDDTVVAGTTPLPAGLRGRGNRFRITRQAVPAPEAVAYWTAGQHALRMSAYYEVGAALLEPEPETHRAPRVLSYGVVTLVRGAPRLIGSRSTQTFTPPGQPGPVLVELQPAEAAIGDRIELLGVELAGDDVELSVQQGTWPQAMVVDPVAWGVVASADRVTAAVASDADGEPVLPGVYSASITVITDLPQPDGGVRRVRASSNVTPFTVAPGVTALAGPTAAGVVTVTGGRFDPALLPDDAIRVLVGTTALERRATGATQPGEFRVDASDQLELRLPSGLATGEQVPVRIVVRGAESPPRWVTVP